eukprot:TRINITY_DN1888_c0_g1_i1.p1 TRINITY_DN1888_c0_g1~~TRINITY_DN1888_c0_g1_i1.p1  ORF type:complete len:159 (+),score=57.45 TRINITY_DN1888_c0_g1_i1:63-479(+)
MKVEQVMTKGLEVISADCFLFEAAQMMESKNIGAIPVFQKDKNNLTSMITDRDLVLRGMARGKDPKTTRISEIATSGIHFANANEELNSVVKLMGDKQIRRVVVMENQKYVGMVSLDDLARSADSELALHALRGISSQ